MLFLNLVQLGEGSRDTRRRADLSTIGSSNEQAGEVRQVIDQFSSDSARLITLASREDGTQTAEITHEALIDNWHSLNEWLNASRTDLRLQRRLGEAARHWESTGKPDGLLWRSPDLDLARELNENPEMEFDGVTSEFFSASESETKKKQSRARLWRNIMALAALVFALLTSALVMQSKYLKEEGEKARQSAEAERNATRAARDANAQTEELLVQTAQLLREVEDERNAANQHAKEADEQRSLGRLVDLRNRDVRSSVSNSKEYAN